MRALFCLNVIMRLVYPVMILDSLLQQSQPLPVDGSSDDVVWRLLSAVTAYVLAYRGHYTSDAVWSLYLHSLLHFFFIVLTDLMITLGQLGLLGMTLWWLVAALVVGHLLE